MTFGKNKGLKKSKNLRKSDRHAFAKKEWFKLMTAPTFGSSRPAGWIPCNTTIGKKEAVDNVMNRVCELAYSDIDQTKAQWRKIRMQVEKVEGGHLYSSFNGIGITRERIVSQLKKKVTLIDSFSDVKTGDGYILRVFCLLSTKGYEGQRKENCYAQTSQVRLIRKLITKILTEKAASTNVDNFVNGILADDTPKVLLNESSKIYPIRFCIVTKINVIKKAKIDVGKLMEDSQAKKGEVLPSETAAKNTISQEQAELKEKAEAK